MSKLKSRLLQKCWRIIVEGFCSIGSTEQIFVNPFFVTSVSFTRMFYYKTCREQYFPTSNPTTTEKDDNER